MAEGDASAEVVDAWDAFIGDPQAPWGDGEHPRFRALARAIGRLRTAVAEARIRETGSQAGGGEFDAPPPIGR